VRAVRVLGIAAVVAASVVYCLPRHPSAGNQTLLDAVVHVAFFLALAAALVPIHKPAWTLAALAVLGVTLEVVQWRLIGFAHLEWNDIASNEAGVALAALVAWAYRRTHPA
jgi:predicted membrane-bound dolichyl-phosphate-mannose-protein mannosyltransferase